MITFAGLPPTIEYGGTSFVTTDWDVKAVSEADHSTQQMGDSCTSYLLKLNLTGPAGLCRTASSRSKSLRYDPS